MANLGACACSSHRALLFPPPKGPGYEARIHPCIVLTTPTVYSDHIKSGICREVVEVKINSKGDLLGPQPSGVYTQGPGGGGQGIRTPPSCFKVDDVCCIIMRRLQVAKCVWSAVKLELEGID